jgi:hypothetical protein
LSQSILWTLSRRGGASEEKVHQEALLVFAGGLLDWTTILLPKFGLRLDVHMSAAIVAASPTQAMIRGRNTGIDGVHTVGSCLRGGGSESVSSQGIPVLQ